MRVKIRAQEQQIDEETHTWIENRAFFFLSKSISAISLVTITLLESQDRDTRGDTICVVTLALVQQRSLVVRDHKQHMEEALNSALMRASHSLQRQLKRERLFGFKPQVPRHL